MRLNEGKRFVMKGFLQFLLLTFKIFRDFLTGFHRRKLQRKKEAQEKFDKQLKEERKRIKREGIESYKKLVVSHRTIPELENLLSEQYEDDEVTVKITELSTNEIAKQNNWIGHNQPKYETDEDSKGDDEESEEELVPGMELNIKENKHLPKEKVESADKFKSHKDVKKVLRKEATKKVKKSKIFQRKNKVEQVKQRKKALLKRKELKKIEKKFCKRKGNKQNK